MASGRRPGFSSIMTTASPCGRAGPARPSELPSIGSPPLHDMYHSSHFQACTTPLAATARGSPHRDGATPLARILTWAAGPGKTLAPRNLPPPAPLAPALPAPALPQFQRALWFHLPASTAEMSVAASACCGPGAAGTPIASSCGWRWKPGRRGHQSGTGGNRCQRDTPLPVFSLQ